MTRISDRLLVQPLDLDAVVIIDESSGEEVVIPAENVGDVTLALMAFGKTRAEILQAQARP